jgi:membrane-bound serine protease (ClpP class)
VREAVSLSADEAVAQKVADFVAPDLPALLQAVDGRRVNAAGVAHTLHTRGAPVVTVEPDWRARLLAVIADPSVALIFMMLGIYALIFEFSTPGMVLPGVAGGIFLLVGLFALQMLPLSFAGLALVVLGTGCMVAEAFLPSFGALGIGGVIAFAIGAVMLVDTDVPGFGIPYSLIGVLAASTLLVSFGISALALRARRAPVVSGDASLIGSIGQIVESKDGETWALVRGEHWRVRATGVALPHGERVRVTARRGLVLDVEPRPARAANGPVGPVGPTPPAPP